MGKLNQNCNVKPLPCTTLFRRIKVSSNELIYYIRQDRKLSKAFDRCNNEQKRRVLAEAEGDTWRLLDLIEDILEDER